MAVEIERKFLVTNEGWREGAEPTRISQGYLAVDKGLSVRIRIRDEVATLTVKGERSGLVREEFEYEVPVEDARAMLAMCPAPAIVKTRYEVRRGQVLWEIDEFHGRHAGLIIAEVELARPDQLLDLPDWIGEEVTHDLRYRNSFLSRSIVPSDGVKSPDIAGLIA